MTAHNHSIIAAFAECVADKAEFQCENDMIFTSNYNAICNKNTLQNDAKFNQKLKEICVYFNVIFTAIYNTICNRIRIENDMIMHLFPTRKAIVFGLCKIVRTH